MNYQDEYNNKIKENVSKALQELGTQINCKTRIERLNKICGKTSFAMQINELKEFLSNFYDDKKV